MPEFGEFDAALPALELVSKSRALHRPKRMNAAVLPHAIQRVEARRGELPSGRREVEIRVSCRADDLGPTGPKLPVELFGVLWAQRH